MQNVKKSLQNQKTREGKKSMKKPSLVIMAAGMGSRYGGLKQIDALDGHGHTIIDYSVYDAIKVGFRDVIFVIKKEIEEQFRATVGSRLESKGISIRYAFQELDSTPNGRTAPEGRKKPYGTAHAILCAKDLLDSPFAVINSDDYYGSRAFELMYSYLTSLDSDSDGDYAMIGYRIGNTVSRNGGVSRGICSSDSNGNLTNIKETHNIIMENEKVYTESKDCGRVELDPSSLVSMNFWGFDLKFCNKLERLYAEFFDNELACDPLFAEFSLPTLIESLLLRGECSVKVLETNDKWHGVTSREDRLDVGQALSDLIDSGKYPVDF